MPAVYAKAGGVALEDFLERERREEAEASAYDAGIQDDSRDGGSNLKVHELSSNGRGSDGGAGAVEQNDAGTPPAAVAETSCFGRPEAYDVNTSFEEGRKLYRVIIVPVPEVCLGNDAHALIGGGAIYEIDGRTFIIQNRKPLE